MGQMRMPTTEYFPEFLKPKGRDRHAEKLEKNEEELRGFRLALDKEKAERKKDMADLKTFLKHKLLFVEAVQQIQHDKHGGSPETPIGNRGREHLDAAGPRRTQENAHLQLQVSAISQHVDVLQQHMAVLYENIESFFQEHVRVNQIAQ